MGIDRLTMKNGHFNRYTDDEPSHFRVGSTALYLKLG